MLAICALLAFGAFASTALSPPAAHATCREPPCIKEPGDDPSPTPTPAPTQTKISSISPGFAWSGDQLTLAGTGFTGANVTINNQPATISSATSTKLVVIVPTLTNTVAGPVSVPVVVSSPTGTASTSFTLSPTLETSAVQTFGVNAEFGQGTDGTARATATLDRASGFANSRLTVVDNQFWASLSVNMSTVWLDSSNRVIGYTDADNVTATGFFYHWPSGDTTTSGDFTRVVKPSPGNASQAHSARIVLVRDHGAELMSTLSNAVAAAQTFAEVISKLAAFV